MNRRSTDERLSALPSEFSELFDAARRGPQAPAVSLELLVAYIDGMLPTEDVRKDIQFLVEHDPKWRWAHSELRLEGE